MDSDSKYSIGAKNGSPKVSLKLKPSPILFNKFKNGGPTPPKRIKLDVAKRISFGNNNTRPKLSILEQKRKLPIFHNRNKLIELIKRHKTLVILGEAGSGKTTQIPQYVNSARLQENGKIAITQPRRVAAISVAQRVAVEYGNGMDLGDYIGYTVRFEDCTSKRTKIKYLTDGMLLREAMVDKLLNDYTIIMLDEAHERTIHTDVLFGIVKRAQKIRENRNLTPLKILITSATMDVDHFSKYFNDCKVVYLEGRTYPVNIHFAKQPHMDYQTSCVATLFQIHQEAPADHDILIFLTGQEEIETCAHQIRLLSKDPDVKGPPLRVLALYAAQPSTMQLAVFHPTPVGTRKVIISTNIAETSITIPGIKYVIDSGRVKVRTFHPGTGMEMLRVQKISREQAGQRCGRAGRESEGWCYRLYTKSQYELMKSSSMPEIQRCNLNSVNLQLLALGIHMRSFDFIDKPSDASIEASYDQLRLLGAIDGHSQLTPLGKKMARFPLDPVFSKIILSAEKFNCLKEALAVVALLSSEGILLNPASKRDMALLARQKFHSGYGDHVTLLNIYRTYENIGNNNVKQWCHEHFINMRNILYVRKVNEQLQEICKKLEVQATTCGSELNQLRKCLLTGLCMNVAELGADRKYVTLDKKQAAYIHPSSSLHGQLPHYVIFTEVVQTSKCYLKDLTTVEADWFTEVAPEYFRNRSFKLNGHS